MTLQVELPDKTWLEAATGPPTYLPPQGNLLLFPAKNNSSLPKKEYPILGERCIFCIWNPVSPWKTRPSRCWALTNQECTFLTHGDIWTRSRKQGVLFPQHLGATGGISYVRGRSRNMGRRTEGFPCSNKDLKVPPVAKIPPNDNIKCWQSMWSNRNSCS